MLCPKCNIYLKSLSYKGVTIDKCPECAGVWLDAGEESFASEVLRHAQNEHCVDCTHLVEKRKCGLLNIFVNSDFHCARFIRK